MNTDNYAANETMRVAAIDFVNTLGVSNRDWLRRNLKAVEIHSDGLRYLKKALQLAELPPPVPVRRCECGPTIVNGQCNTRPFV